MYNEPINKKDVWDPFFNKGFLGFSTYSFFECNLKSLENWPQIVDYNQLARTQYNKENTPFVYQVKFIEQEPHMDYMVQIQQYHQIPTRMKCWHDFFNNLTWMIFPKIKWAITLKYGLNNKDRTPLQNVLAHLDECGMILCSDDSKWFDYVKKCEWKNIFWQERAALLNHCYPLIIGHGILEKGLAPYIGLTAKAIFLKTSSSFLSLPQEEKIRYIDSSISNYILSANFPSIPSSLAPIPLLGWPKWHIENDKEYFYDNTNYFRTHRKVESLRFAEYQT